MQYRTRREEKVLHTQYIGMAS